MGARGFNIAEEGHIVPLVLPESISGGVSSQIFNMRDAAKCNILLIFGALAAAEGNVQLFACSDLAGDGAVAIGFDLFTQALAGPGNDVLGARTAVTSAGFTPANTPGIAMVLHVQADQMQQLPYLKLVIGDGTNADYACAVAILTGLRYQGDLNQTATT